MKTLQLHLIIGTTVSLQLKFLIFFFWLYFTVMKLDSIFLGLILFSLMAPNHHFGIDVTPPPPPERLLTGILGAA